MLGTLLMLGCYVAFLGLLIYFLLTRFYEED